MNSDNKALIAEAREWKHGNDIVLRLADALEAAERALFAARIDATDLVERLLNIGQEAKRQAERATAAETRVKELEAENLRLNEILFDTDNLLRGSDDAMKIELNYWRQNSAEAWDKCEERRLVQIAAETRVKELEAMVDKLLNHCPDAECGECSEIVCPHGDSLHLHHDGCPSCCSEAAALSPAPAQEPSHDDK